MSNDNIFRLEIADTKVQEAPPMAYDQGGAALELKSDFGEFPSPTEDGFSAGVVHNDSYSTSTSLVMSEWIETPGAVEQRRMFLIGGILAALIAVAGFVLFTKAGEELLVSLMGTKNVTPTFVSSPKKATKSTPIKAVETRVVAPENPYWDLPNQALPALDSTARVWTTADEQRWRAALEHQYPYQRYKAVEDIRAFRLRGSESLLWLALEQPKFWTRISAAIGLAEFGISLNVEHIEKVIAHTRPALVHHYLERFLAESDEATRYVLRLMLKVADATARYKIVSALVNANDPMLDLYLVAASYDPNAKLSQFAQSSLARRQLDRETYLAYDRYVLGQSELLPQLNRGDTGASLKKSEVNTPTEAMVENKPIKAEKVSSHNEVISSLSYYTQKAAEKSRAALKLPSNDDGYMDLQVIEIK